MSYLQAVNAGLINPSTQVASYNYNSLTYPITSPLSIGYQYFEEYSTGWPLTVTSLTWTSLYSDNIEYPAGVYMLNAVFTYTTSDTPSVNGGDFLIGLVDSITTLDPVAGYFCGSSTTKGNLNLSVPFISNGTTKTKIIFSYAINIANITVEGISYNLTRIG